MQITRRSTLASIASSVAALIVGSSRSADAVSLPKGLPFVPDQLADRDLIWSWVQRLNSYGPRLTGSPAQRASIEFIADELVAIGLPVQRDTHKMIRWTARTTGLRLQGGVAIPVASAFPYSGHTQPEGVTAPLVWLGERPKSLEAAAGKIAVVPVKNIAITSQVRDRMFTRKAFYPDRNAADLSGTITTPLLSGLNPGIDLKSAKAAGILGVICVFQDMSEASAREEYLPFTTPYQDCPAIWVGPAAGHSLKAACEKGETATLTLEADLDHGVESSTLYTVLEGTNIEETIIVNTHTDGPNACEENGAAALLALAQYMSRLPKEARRRSVVFAFITGHFQMPQFGKDGGKATSGWLSDHPELWDGKAGNRKAVASLTIEHLGCTEWKDNAAKTASVRTGKLERELVYTTNGVMDRVYGDAVAGRKKIRALTVAPRNGVFLGEGQPLFAAGIPGIAMCPIPDYLCAEPVGGDIDRLDPDFVQQQVETFAKALLQIDRLPTTVIGTPEPYKITLLNSIGRRLEAMGKH